MYCQLGQDIFQLRQQNRDLLLELETNSVLLENRLMKLRDTARTSRHSDKSWKELPPSPLKRKYESWKARTSSSHISATRTTESIDPEQENLKPSSNSTAKRSKRNITIVSGVKKKHRHSRCHEQPRTSKPTPQKSAKEKKIIQKKKKPCAQCYCPDIYIETKNKTDGSKVTGNVYIDTKGCETRTCSGCCGDHSEIEGLPSQGSLGDGKGLSRKTIESQTASDVCPVAESIHFTTPCNSPHLVKSLEDVYSVLNYSPESVFLRRFKKRAELLQRNFQAGPVGGKNSKTVRENKAECDSDSDLEHAVKKLQESTRTRQVPTRLISSNRTKRGASKIKSAQEKHASSRITRVPVRQLCSCRRRGDRTGARSPREKKSSPRSAEVKQIPIFPLGSSRDGSDDEGRASARDQARLTLRDLERKPCYEREDRSPCYCCRILASQRCPCKACRCRTIHKYLNDHDTASELGKSRGNCCSPKAADNKAWFDELKRFRYKNWCECHAHDHDELSEKGIDVDLGTDLFQLDPPQPEQRCLERFVIDGVDYFVPGYAVPNKTTCTSARASSVQRGESPPLNNLPKEVERNKITLPSKRKPKETSPVSPRKETNRKSSKNVSKGTPGSKRQPSYLISRTGSVTRYKAPVPTNTFALRYQKGVV